MNEHLDPKAAETLKEKPSIDYSIILKGCLIDESVEYPVPEAVLSVETHGQTIPVMTKGSISGIIGRPKGGKTSFVSLIAAVVLKGNIGNEQLQLKCDIPGSLLFFDTEQGRYYASLTRSRIKKMSQNTSKLSYYDLREYPPDTRFNLIDTALKEHDEVSLVIIDGGRDITYDINSSEESITVITNLMALSVKHHTHICILLHQNKGDANARGHFGTELVNKSETIFSVNKANHDKKIMIVDALFTRGLSFEPIAISREDDGTPYILGSAEFMEADTGKKKSLNASDFPEELHLEIISKVFSDCNELTYAKMWKAIQYSFSEAENISFGHSKAKEFLKYYVDNEWVHTEKPSKGNTLYKPV